jgi:hypothetical protein
VDSDLGCAWVGVDVFVVFFLFVTHLVLQCPALPQQPHLIGVGVLNCVHTFAVFWVVDEDDDHQSFFDLVELFVDGIVELDGDYGLGAHFLYLYRRDLDNVAGVEVAISYFFALLLGGLGPTHVVLDIGYSLDYEDADIKFVDPKGFVFS